MDTVPGWRRRFGGPCQRVEGQGVVAQRENQASRGYQSRRPSGLVSRHWLVAGGRGDAGRGEPTAFIIISVVFQSPEDFVFYFGTDKVI